MELSRRMETMIEQVLPFAPIEEENPDIIYQSSLENSQGDVSETIAEMEKLKKSQEKLNRSHSSQQSAHQAGVIGSDQRTAIAPHDRLANFYKQYNKILLDNLAIAKEKERLELENAQLQDLIKQYIDGTKLSDEVLAEDNPLIVVNGRYFFP